MKRETVEEWLSKGNRITKVAANTSPAQHNWSVKDTSWASIRMPREPKPPKPQKSSQTPTAPKVSKQDKRAKVVTFNGKSQSIAAHARELGVSLQALSKRLRRGWNVEQTMTKPVHVNQLITFNGKTLTAYGWAKELGVTNHSIMRRLAKGMSVEEALTKPFVKKTRTKKAA